MPAGAATKAKPAYVSVGTRSVVITVLTLNGAPSGLAPAIVNVTPTTNGCAVDGAHPGNYTCTLSTSVPAGADSLQISLYSNTGGTGPLLAQQIASATIAAGTTYNLNVVLDADPGPVTVTAPANTGISGTQATGFVTGGSIGQTLAFTIADNGVNVIAPGLPGAPVMSATSTAPSVASVSVNSAARTVTVTPGTAYGTTTIAVIAQPATTTSGLTPSAGSFAVTNAPLLAAGGCLATCTTSVFAYNAGAFVTYGTLPSASFGSDLISALALDGNTSLYAADLTADTILEFANAGIDMPSPAVAPLPGLRVGAVNGLNGTAGFDVTREGTLSVANALGVNASTDQFTAFPVGSNSRILGKAFGATIIGESVAAMPSTTGTVAGYATALYDSIANTGTVGVVIPGGSGSTCDTALLPSVPCGLIPLASGQGVSADGAFDLVWDRADQALIVANYNAGTNNYDLVQLNWSGSSFAAPSTLQRPPAANGAVYNNSGPWLSVSRDGHVAAVFTTSGANYDVRIYGPGASGSGRPFNDISTIPQTTGILSVAFLPDNSPVILNGGAANNLCVYNPSTFLVSACTTVANAIDAAASGMSAHRIINARPQGRGRERLWKHASPR